MQTLITNKLLAIREQIDVLTKKFEDLILLNYPEKDIENVIRYMNEMSNGFEEKLSSYETEGVNVVDLKLFSQLANFFYNRVGCVVNCDVKNHPREVMVPVKEILRELNGKHVFITEPNWELNYSVGPLIHKEYKDALKRCGIEIDDDVEVIRLVFPKLHQGNVLSGAIMAHELGHYIDVHYSIECTEQIIVKLMNSIDLSKYLLYYKSTTLGKTISEDRLKGILPNAILRNWIREVVADIIGVILYGVSSYFSGEHMSMFFSDIDNSTNTLLQRFSDTHPRDGFRNGVRIKTLRKLGYYEILKDDVKTKIEEYEKQWAGARTILRNFGNYMFGSDEYIVINSNYLLYLENDIKMNLDWMIELVINEIKAISPNLIYDINKFNSEIPCLIESIINMVPPNEINGQPVDSVSIINAGWLVYTLYIDKMKTNISGSTEHLNNIDVKDIIDGLLKKAITSAHVHRRWLNATSK